MKAFFEHRATVKSPIYASLFLNGVCSPLAFDIELIYVIDGVWASLICNIRIHSGDFAIWEATISITIKASISILF